MKAKMTAAVLYGKEDVRIEQVEVPPVGEGELLVKVKAALTCGTDVKVYRRGYHAKAIKPPSVFGHEWAGVITEVGRGVKGFEKGMRVVGANSAPCGECFYCRRSAPTMCDDLLFLNGAYAEFIKVPERIVRQNLLPIPEHLSFQEAALTEPLACVVRGVEETGVRRDETVAVLGTGPIGLMFVRLCKWIGAQVIAVGRREGRLKMAKLLGADSVVDAEQVEDVVQAVKVLTEGGRGVDKAIECVGKPEAWQTAIQLVRRGGTVQLFGGCPADTTIPLDATLMHYSELTLKSSFHHTPRCVREALRLISERIVDARQWVSAEEPLCKLPEVLAGLANGSGALKIAIIPDSEELTADFR